MGIIGSLIPSLVIGGPIDYFGLEEYSPLSDFGGNLRDKRSQEVVQYLPEGGLAERRMPTIIQGQDIANSKRTTLLLDKLMYALQNTMDGNPNNHAKLLATLNTEALGKQLDAMGLERRGNTHGKVYWRCYFNAV